MLVIVAFVSYLCRNLELSSYLHLETPNLMCMMLRHCQSATSNGDPNAYMHTNNSHYVNGCEYALQIAICMGQMMLN